MTALARRVVACKGWRWMPGMKAYGLRPDGALGATFRVASDSQDPTGLGIPTVPDLDDPATLGCLLALVREAWGSVTIHEMTGPHGGALTVSENRGVMLFRATGGSTLERRVKCLEAAP